MGLQAITGGQIPWPPRQEEDNMPMDPLKAHAMALDAIDELTKTPAVKKYLKPLDSEATVVYRYQCLVCNLCFWTDRDLYFESEIFCPTCGEECDYKGKETK